MLPGPLEPACQEMLLQACCTDKPPFVSVVTRRADYDIVLGEKWKSGAASVHAFGRCSDSLSQITGGSREDGSKSTSLSYHSRLLRSIQLLRFITLILCPNT